MPRKKVYKTPEQKREAQRENAKRYYEKNKDAIKEKRMQRYWKTKELDEEMS